MTGPTERLPSRLPDTEDTTTVELPRLQPQRSGAWRELAGALAIGLVCLALAVLALQIGVSAQGMPGPGLWVVLGHFALAAAAVVAQRFADRMRGPQAALAITLVLVATGVVIWFFWWA